MQMPPKMRSSTMNTHVPSKIKLFPIKNQLNLLPKYGLPIGKPMICIRKYGFRMEKTKSNELIFNQKKFVKKKKKASAES